ncbi:hypothetical protein ACFL17_01645, partial [Pseudomonadota bacterium]
MGKTGKFVGKDKVADKDNKEKKAKKPDSDSKKGDRKGSKKRSELHVAGIYKNYKCDYIDCGLE